MHRSFASRVSVSLFAVGGWLLAGGCQTARMSLDDGLRSRAEEWAVEGRQRVGFRESLAFGPYRVTDIQRGQRRARTQDTQDYRSAQFRSAQARQRFEFRIHHGQGRPLWAHAATSVRWQDVQAPFLRGTGTVELDTETVFACTFDADSEPTWFLAMSQGTDDLVLNGALVQEERTLQVRGIRNLQGTPMPLLSPAGYIFLENGRVVAAVEVINRGAVWMDPDLDPEVRDPVAAAMAALMLYRDIQ